MQDVEKAMMWFDDKSMYLACGYTDMRKSMNELSAIVEGSFQLDPFDDALFVFCNRHRVKILEWDGTDSGCILGGWKKVILAGRPLEMRPP